MAKCDVCGKNSLLPEKLGDSNVCKVCFLKVNGPLWKYRNYEKYEDVEKNRNKVLIKATEENFPSIVVDGINVFFNAQTNGMMKCDACGEVVQTLHPLHNSKLCNGCFSKINTFEWKKQITQAMKM